MAKKAFKVYDGDETTVVVFAERNVVARRRGANEMDVEFESVESCVRAPQFDQYAETGVVPAEALIDDGWWLECFGCYRRVDSDLEGDVHAYGRSRVVRLKPVYVGREVYCCPSCKSRYEKDRSIKQGREAAAIADFKARVLRRFPDAEFIDKTFRQHAYCSQGEGGHYGMQQICVSFRFPGMKIGPASYQYDLSDCYGLIGPRHPEFYCCGGDKEAFEAWARGDAVPSDERKAA